MSNNHYGSEQHVRNGSENAERFQEKFLQHSKSTGERLREGTAFRKEPGVFEKLRLRVQQRSKTVWRWGVGNPAKEQSRISYKVRGGKLTVADDEGRVIRESKERGLEQYNGMTLHAKENREGEMELKENVRDRQKLAQANAQLTPHEQRQKHGWSGKLMAFVVNFGKKKARVKNSLVVDKAARAGYRIERRRKKGNIRMK
ncbi:hypothetical protein N836_07240 [Leptolyngbya sp. Heron Island J]|uniref:hypothetical protein n=1 Tax=Leptolyngbya sp. Heron Island J TaxID=1385935 RepID=UPI0003B93EB9|nr:hypothetical protein [Leptolyngbya sp. Heron Island J]ESA36561.1 hypothetical protein N836_07240 [Leptolyngbya sp. Heron Island J]